MFQTTLIPIESKIVHSFFKYFKSKLNKNYGECQLLIISDTQKPFLI
jgi:hypothetical protein